MSDLLDQIKALATKLVFEEDFDQKQIYREVTQHLKKEAGKYPKTPVLYCASYGGFGYSDEFCDFFNTKCLPSLPSPHEITQLHDLRTDMVPHIVQFGADICASNPLLEKLLYAYVFFDVQAIMKECHNHLQNIKYLASLKEAHASLIAHMNAANDHNTSTSPSPSKTMYDFGWLMCIYQCMKWHEYVPESLNEIKETLEKQIGVFEKDIIRFKHTHLNKRVLAFLEKTKATTSCRKINFLKHLEALDVNSPDLWLHQSHVDQKAMEFICESGLYEELDELNSPTIKTKVHTLTGLICASGECCKLDIRYVPYKMGYEIHEYDGLESVEII
jgi:hypothetical protein